MSFFRNGVVGRQKADDTPRQRRRSRRRRDCCASALIGERPRLWLAVRGERRRSEPPGCGARLDRRPDRRHARLSGGNAGMDHRGGARRTWRSRCSPPSSTRRRTRCSPRGAAAAPASTACRSPSPAGGDRGCRMIATKGFFKHKIWIAPWPHTENTWFNSIAYRLALIAAGRGRRHLVADRQERMGHRRRRAAGRGGRGPDHRRDRRAR